MDRLRCLQVETQPEAMIRRALFSLGLILVPTAALAHRGAPAGPKTGLSLPSVTHGQMVVLAENRAAVADLAARQYPTDPQMRRIEGFVSLQYFYCGWGLVPGSLYDENSPFNECSHAYLAGVRFLLLHLQDMPGNRAAKQALGRKIDIEMLEHQASMMLCRFSDEPFNTADVIVPRIGEILTNPTCFAAILEIALLAMLVGATVSKVFSRAPHVDRQALRALARDRRASPTAAHQGRLCDRRAPTKEG